jgi:cell division transport system ATP-binding protein
LDNVHKRYPNGAQALSAVNLSVESGEMLCLTGLSGAGKTTLLRLIAALEQPSSGRIEVHGLDITRISRRAIPYLRRNLGLILQEQRLLFDRTVLENVIIPLAVIGTQRTPAIERARAALDKVGLLARAASNPAALSAGEQQRVCIARAVVARPSLLLADEPTANVDAAHAGRIFETFRAFNAAGVTVIVASHDQALVERYGSRVVMLEAGAIIQ